jgi:uncharacterized membrane protein YdjX (TVP38/TMEM64 family)
MPEPGRPRFFTVGRVLLLLVVASAIAAFFLAGGPQQFTLERFRDQPDWLQEQVAQHLVLSALIFFLAYVLVTSLSLPIATILSLLAGFVFDLWLGVLLVSFASTTGATLAFLGSRYLFGELVQSRFARWVKAFNRGLDKDGPYYLLTLRLVPAIPFFVVNLVMGLTKMPVRRFWLYSQLGMLPATFLYVNAGKQLGSIESPGDVLSLKLLISLALLGVAPLLFRLTLNWWRGR